VRRVRCEARGDALQRLVRVRVRLRLRLRLRVRARVRVRVRARVRVRVRDALQRLAHDGAGRARQGLGAALLVIEERDDAHIARSGRRRGRAIDERAWLG